MHADHTRSSRSLGGVKRQYLGCAGRVANGINTVHLCCAVTAALLKDRTVTQAPPPTRPDQPSQPEPGMIPLAIPEIKRVLAALTTRP